MSTMNRRAMLRGSAGYGAAGVLGGMLGWITLAGSAQASPFPAANPVPERPEDSLVDPAQVVVVRPRRRRRRRRVCWWRRGRRVCTWR
ncbi:hypothetical protein [Methylobacterium oryzisoli]|uniref:hypothetical protein n=1 Tax=Methylobacterium oryzisoli TaxID=3385502 RepID=UPI003891A1BA